MVNVLNDSVQIIISSTGTYFSFIITQVNVAIIHEMFLLSFLFSMPKRMQIGSFFHLMFKYFTPCPRPPFL